MDRIETLLRAFVADPMGGGNLVLADALEEAGNPYHARLRCQPGTFEGRGGFRTMRQVMEDEAAAAIQALTKHLRLFAETSNDELGSVNWMMSAVDGQLPFRREGSRTTPADVVLCWGEEFDRLKITGFSAFCGESPVDVAIALFVPGEQAVTLARVALFPDHWVYIPAPLRL